MVKQNYSNLSIESKRYYNIRRKWENNSNTELTFSAYTIKILENCVEREILLTKLYPHLKVVKISNKEMVIEDSKKNEFVKLFKSGNKIDSSISNPDYINFAMLHPEFPM